MVSRRPGSILDLVCKLGRAHPQGTVFNYSTGESCVLAALVAAATGRPLADYFAEKVWGPAGMEADAHWQLESDDGLELGGLGVSARLRDAGRFGLFILEDGAAYNGGQVLPPGWRDLAGRPDCPATAYGALRPGDAGGYGYHWWATPPVPGIHNGVFAALGAYGQTLYVNPPEQMVIAVQSAWRQSEDLAGRLETVALIRAAVRALRP
jgi:CubicO group peptidase (beta-lactamase class C family)